MSQHAEWMRRHNLMIVHHIIDYGFSEDDPGTDLEIVPTHPIGSGTMDAILVRTDGTYETLTGDVQSTDWLRQHVECQWLEAVYVDVPAVGRLVAWMDEEGRLDHKPENPAASILLCYLGRGVGNVVGNVVFTSMKGEDNEPLSDIQAAAIIDELEHL